MNKKNTVTLKEVAKLAGVSAMTASRALRKAKDVSNATIEKVERAAADLGYVGNSFAGSLSSKRSDLVAVIMPSLTNTVFPEVLGGVNESLEAGGLQPVFGLSEYSAEKEASIVRRLLAWNPAGVILPGVDQLPEIRELLDNAGVPVVQVMDLSSDPIDCQVGFSHTQSGIRMATELLGRGYSSFAYIGGGVGRDIRAEKRRDGFRSALLQAGCDWTSQFIETQSSSIELGGELMNAVHRRQLPQVLYCANDDIAAGAVFECMRLGIQVPTQLVVVGFNGLSITDALPVQIVTDRSPRYAMGQAAGDMIVDAIEQGGTRLGVQLKMQPQLDWGDLKDN